MPVDVSTASTIHAGRRAAIERMRTRIERTTLALMEDTCSIRRPVFTPSVTGARLTQTFVTVSASSPCRLRTPSSGQADSDLVHAVNADAMVHLPLSVSVQLDDEITIDGVTYSVAGFGVENTYRYERKVAVRTTYARGESLP